MKGEQTVATDIIHRQQPLSMDNVCNRRLFPFPSKVEMAEEQEYLNKQMLQREINLENYLLNYKFWWILIKFWIHLENQPSDSIAHIVPPLTKYKLL